jgi:hypothetical protein
MMTLGVFRGAGEHAAVVVDRGTVVSAVHSTGSGEGMGVPVAVDRALTLAGVRLADTEIVSTSNNELLPDARVVSARMAQASQVRAVAPGAHAAIVLDDGGGSAWIVDLATLDARAIDCLASPLLIMQSVARAVGFGCTDPVAALESIALAEPCSSAVTPLLDNLAGRRLTTAEIAASPHVEIQRLRALAATAALEGLATALAAVVEQSTRDGAGGDVVLAGSLGESPEFVVRLRRRVDILVAAVPERFGEALGAALLPHRDVRALPHLALGAAFSESDIKATLENCRLDYVYEPDWSRLYLRVSELLATGALIGWYQGRAEFSRQSFGNRSVLCDPSRRYSRENVNVFLLNRSAHAPLSVSLASPAPMMAHDPPRRFAYTTATPDVAATQRLGSAIDRHGNVRCHVADPDATPEFHALLRTHRERTQVPGLLNIPMLTGDVLAPTPRDAIRETYASATDALVIGRFLVAKDYWLLRGRAATAVSS